MNRPDMVLTPYLPQFLAVSVGSYSYWDPPSARARAAWYLVASISTLGFLLPVIFRSVPGHEIKEGRYESW
jgi:hypothetical protein